MSNDPDSAAERFMREQIAIMSKYGDAPKLSDERVRAAVQSTAKTFDALSTSTREYETEGEDAEE